MTLKKVKNKSSKVNPREMHKVYLDKIEDGLIEDSVPFFDPALGTLSINDEYLVMPEEITEVSSKDLGEYLNAFTQNKMYLRTLLGRTEIQCEIARREYYDKSSKLYKALSGNKMSETAKDRVINTSPEVAEYYQTFSDWDMRRRMLLSTIANMEDAIFLFSREVSRRNADYEEENRNHNVGSM